LLQIVLDRGQRADWFAAPWVWAFTSIAVISLIALVIRELRFPEPILDLNIFKIGQFDASVIIITAMILVIFGLNLLNPLFFQELLGYSAWKSGLAVVPRGLGTFAAMLLVGQLSRRGFDTRALVGCGFALMGFALWSMGHWNLEISLSNVIFPMMLSGVASGLIFPIMSASALACVERERMGYAASLYNMTRNTGSAIGISLVTNLLNSRLQLHQSYLAEHFTIFQAWQLDAAAPARMPGAPGIGLMHGLTINHPQGLGMMYRTIQQQASLLAFNDIYRLLATMALVFVPAFLFLKQLRAGSSAGH
jgi:MFS transporter, DHA2 family, multidrug resistance protein